MGLDLTAAARESSPRRGTCRNLTRCARLASPLVPLLVVVRTTTPGGAAAALRAAADGDGDGMGGEEGDEPISALKLLVKLAVFVFIWKALWV